MSDLLEPKELQRLTALPNLTRGDLTRLCKHWHCGKNEADNGTEAHAKVWKLEKRYRDAPPCC